MEIDVLPSQSNVFRQIASPWHTALVVTVEAAMVLRGFLKVGHLRAANPDRIMLYEKTILFQWLTLALVLAGVWLHGLPLRTILGERWSSARQLFRDIGLGLGFLFVSTIITSILGPHGNASGGGPDQAIKFLLPQGGAEIALWVVLSLTAGICEEAIYRGYLQRQFMAFSRSVPVGIILAALAFGASHAYQGLGRASVIALMAVLAGSVAYWSRSVRPGMIAHALQDLMAIFVRS